MAEFSVFHDKFELKNLGQISVIQLPKLAGRDSAVEGAGSQIKCDLNHTRYVIVIDFDSIKIKIKIISICSVFLKWGCYFCCISSTANFDPMKAKFEQRYVAKAVNPDQLTTPYIPDFFKEHGAILYQFLPTAKGNELLPGEVKYGYRFYLLDDPSKEGVFYLSSHSDMETLKSRSKFLSRVEREILKIS